nr:RNA-directed DNA polymerase [Tanacetum cinerariifolium]
TGGEVSELLEPLYQPLLSSTKAREGSSGEENLQKNDTSLEELHNLAGGTDIKDIMSSGQRDALLVFRTLCKVHIFSYLLDCLLNFGYKLSRRYGSVNRTTGKSPFEVVYGRNPITPLDLVHVLEVGQFSEEGADQSEQIKELHRSVQEQIIRHNKQYKEHTYKHRKQVLYQEGDLVWIHLRKERFPTGHFGKLKPRGDGPFRVLKKINDNAYKIELPGYYNVSATFNVADLLLYKGDSDDEPESGSSFFKKGMMMQMRSTSAST